MSDLVERVIKAINTCEGHEEGFRSHAGYLRTKTEARAAIKAVAEWQMTRDGEQWQAGSFLLAQLKEGSE